MASAKLLGAVALTGLLLILALPLAERAFLAWFALVPLLRAMHGRGFVWGFVAALASIFLAAWIASTGVFYSHKDFEGEPGWIYSGMGLFGVPVALTVGVWADKGTQGKPLWWFASLAVLLEACLLLELPAHLALTQYRQPVPLMLASVGGIWLVSFAIWMVNLALARTSWSWWWAFGVVIGLSQILSNAWLPAQGQKRTYAAIQSESVDLGELTKLHMQASGQGANVVVWPEFSALAIAARGTSDLQALAKAKGVAPFVTTFRDDHRPLPHNAAALFSSSGESERYFKRKPFGAERKMHAAGDRAVATRSPSQAGVGLNICFDSCFPFVMRDTAKQGAGVIALPTIDPPSAHHFMAGMHNAYSPFRAAELGIPIVRADGYAYSSIVDGRGRFVAETPPGEHVLLGDVRGNRRTLYRLFGDWVLYAGGVAFVFGLRKRRRPQ